MAHAQKPDFVFRRNGRVHLNQRKRQFSRLLAAELCASAVVMLDTPYFEVVWRVLGTHSIRQFPLRFPLLRHRVASHFNWSLPLRLTRITVLLLQSSCLVRLVCWVLTPRRLADKYQSFGGICCSENEGSRCLWNVVAFYETTCPYITGDFGRRTHHCENLKFRTTLLYT